ncbi:unnamed protein product [Urochloa humidicola]
MLGSGFLEFKLQYSEWRNLAIGQTVSESFSAGGHRWKIKCYPHGNRIENNGEYVSIFLKLVSKSENVKALFDVFLLNRDGTPSMFRAKRLLFVFCQSKLPHGWSRYVKRTKLESTYLTNGSVRFMYGVMVFPDNPMPTPMPPPDIGVHFGQLLDGGDGSDVSFIVNGEMFHAHRAVLAARSPFFKAELFGAMVDATMPSITLHDIEPAAFKVMLRFMYTDSFPADEELGDSATDMLQHLLAAADRFALDRLKLICSLKLMENVSVDTFGSILICAETYNCSDLKNKCLDFFAVEKNFKEVAFTDGFVLLIQKYPSLAAELRKRVLSSSVQP